MYECGLNGNVFSYFSQILVYKDPLVSWGILKWSLKSLVYVIHTKYVVNLSIQIDWTHLVHLKWTINLFNGTMLGEFLSHSIIFFNKLFLLSFIFFLFSCKSFYPSPVSDLWTCLLLYHCISMLEQKYVHMYSTVLKCSSHYLPVSTNIFLNIFHYTQLTHYQGWMVIKTKRWPKLFYCIWNDNNIYISARMACQLVGDMLQSDWLCDLSTLAEIIRSQVWPGVCVPHPP